MSTPPDPPDPLLPTPDGTAPATPPDPLDLRELVDSGQLDVVPGDPPVPISVWRAAAPGRPAAAGHTGELTAALAGLLVGLYTRRGDTVVDLTADPFIAGAAGAGGRSYVPADSISAVADLDRLAGAVRLVVLRWPTADAGTAALPDLAEVFAGCRRLMAADGCTVVVLAALPADSFYADHARLLIPAAYRAGLGYLQHIVAVTAPITGAPARPRKTPTAAESRPAGASAQVHLDLLVFVITGRRRG